MLNTLQSEIVVVGGSAGGDMLNWVDIFNVDLGVWRAGELDVFEYPITVICGYSDTFLTGLNCSRT